MYSFVSVACAYDDHAPVQNRASAVGGERSSVACLFTQGGVTTVAGFKCQLMKIGGLVILKVASAHWLEFML